MKDGWGLATDGKVLFGSDGSSTLYRIDPQTFKGQSLWWNNFIPFLLPFYLQNHFSRTFLCPAFGLDSTLFSLSVFALHFHGTYIALFNVAISKQVVYYKGHEVHNLNELEYINGEVWANVFMVRRCMINYDCS